MIFWLVVRIPVLVASVSFTVVISFFIGILELPFGESPRDEKFLKTEFNWKFIICIYCAASVIYCWWCILCASQQYRQQGDPIGSNQPLTVYSSNEPIGDVENQHIVSAEEQTL